MELKELYKLKDGLEDGIERDIEKLGKDIEEFRNKLAKRIKDFESKTGLTCGNIAAVPDSGGRRMVYVETGGRDISKKKIRIWL